MQHEQGRGQGRGRGRGRGWAQVPHHNENNNVYPSGWTEGIRDNLAYGGLDEATREALVGVLPTRIRVHADIIWWESFATKDVYLFGVRIDSNDGPRRSSHQAARRISARPLHVQETNNIDSDVITTEKIRDTNYVHRGWSLAAISDTSPWTLSRLARNNQTNTNAVSVTKYVMIQKLRVDILPEHLSPVPELEAAFSEALERPSRFERSKGVYRIFEQWGDVIPLVFDLGISLAITDSEAVARHYLQTTDQSYLGLQQLSMSASARPSTLGGDPTVLQGEDNIKGWLRKPVPSHLWEQVRVVKVAHITTILRGDLQARLAELHQSLTTYCPTTMNAITANGTAFDGAAHASNTLSRVSFYSDGYHIKSISVRYTTNTTELALVEYGVAHATNNEFRLTLGEHITDVIIWKDHKGVCGIQLNTSRGRTSPHFGSESGSPTILRSTGGCLSGFSGVVQGEIIHDLQTIWRHDVQGPGLSGDRVFSRYYGGVAGTPFCDWPSVQNSNSAHIAIIRITYKDSAPHGPGSVSKQANYHGGAGGTERIFRLEPDEHVVAVLGRFNNYIVQLCFVTNRGRTSDIFGGGEGEDFRCQAPETPDGKATRLHYICGKSGNWLNGILLAWAPLE